MKPLVVSIPGEMELAGQLAGAIDGDLADMDLRSFPDGETYIRIDSPVQGRDVVVVASLDRANEKLAPLIYIAETARDLDARRVGLAAPYLAYMRQDKRFQHGEGVTSHYFARLISGIFDWMVTVEPHLHRHGALADIYSIPSQIVRATRPIAEWIAKEVDDPLLVGPDEESEQWVSPVAQAGDFPSLILEKVRRGDYDVEVVEQQATVDTKRQPIVLDDIISTGRTMLEAVRYLGEQGLPAPICVGIHGLFVDDALHQMEMRQIADIVTCNTVSHSTNAIDIRGELAAGVRAMVGGDSSIARVPGGAH